MNDRDRFAAAALTGLLCNGDFSMESIPLHAFSMADAMLRERKKTSVAPVADRKSVATHGACARPCSQPFDSAPITDQERFNAAVMNWISEVSTMLYHDVAKCEGARTIISDACQQCWAAYGKDSTNLDAAPAAKAQVDAAGISRQGTGDTFTLTDAEREAVERVSVAYDLLPTQAARQIAATLRGLLERMK